MSRNPKFDQLLEEMGALHARKNHDYAADDNPYSNFEFAAQFADVPVRTVFLVLLGVKYARLRELVQSGKTPNNESISDTEMDATMYNALMTSYHR